MKILITGGSGFVGANLKKCFCDEHHIYSPGRNQFDLMSEMSIENAIGSYELGIPDCIIHLAAKCGGIGFNKDNEMMTSNLIMGYNVLKVARAFDIKKVIMLATVCAYPKFTPIPFVETDMWKGYPEETNAPYGLSKKIIALMGEEYNRCYGMNVVNLFPANLYGPHDHFEEEKSHVIPALIKKIIHARDNNEKWVEVWGDGTPTREFLYVKDLCNVIKWFVENDIPNDTGFMNVGNGVEISIRDLVDLLCHELKYDGHIEWLTDKPNGQPRRCLNIEKLARIIDKENVPKTRIQDGIRETVSWYEQTRRG